MTAQTHDDDRAEVLKAPAIGQRAPDFVLQNQHGESVSLAQFRGRWSVVLVFYPFAFSGVCTGELAEIRDWVIEPSGDETTAVLAVSCDHMFSLRVFAERERLGFPLLSDFWPHGEVSATYGVFNVKLGCPDRSTFIIDRAGVVRRRVESAMSQARNTDEYRKVLAEIG